MRETTPNARDRALGRLRRATIVVLAAAGALVAAFAGLAAKALPGHHTVTGTRSGANAPRTTQTPVQAAPPPLVPAQSSVTPTPPSAPATPPSQTPAPPVVVSGGT